MGVYTHVLLQCSIVDKGNTNSTKSADVILQKAHDSIRKKIGYGISAGENTQEAEGNYHDVFGNTACVPVAYGRISVAQWLR